MTDKFLRHDKFGSMSLEELCEIEEENITNKKRSDPGMLHGDQVQDEGRSIPITV